MMPTSIQSRKLMLVEGKDEVALFDYFLRMWGRHDVQVMDYQGKRRFNGFFPSIAKTPGFSRLTSLAILRDADDDAKAAFASVADRLRKSGLPVPMQSEHFVGDSPRVGVFIVPGGNQAGMLEDLCLDSAKDDPVMPHVETFMKLIDTDSWRAADYEEDEKRVKFFPNNPSKARVQVFLASRPHDVRSLGHGARYWPHQSEAFQLLKAFVAQL